LAAVLFAVVDFAAALTVFLAVDAAARALFAAAVAVLATALLVAAARLAAVLVVAFAAALLFASSGRWWVCVWARLLSDASCISGSGWSRSGGYYCLPLHARLGIECSLRSATRFSACSASVRVL